MDVSVILATWNNCGRLAITLEALSRCVVPANLKWELVLVNNNSTDDTPNVARRFADTLSLVYVEEPRQGLSRARNAGSEASSGRLIVFIDDDMEPCPEWLAAYWSAYQERSTGFYFGGPITCKHEVPPDQELLRLIPFQSLIGVNWGGEEKALAPNQRFASNWACQAVALKQSGGYDVRLGLDASIGKRRVGEEFDLMERLQQLDMSPWYLPDAHVVHFTPAKKCTLQRVAENTEAQGLYSAHTAQIVPFAENRPDLWPSVATRDGVLHTKIASYWLRWVWARVHGKKGYGEYLSMRFCIGRLRGLKEKRSMAPPP